MPLDDLNKDHSGVGLQKYWKDLFPDRLTTLYVYKGVNQLHRGRNIFSREDDISIISLEKIDEVKGIFGGESFTNGPLTVEEDKNIKELELNNIPSEGFTAFLNDLKHNYKDQNLYFTLGKEFISGDINYENFNVYIAVQTSPNIFAKSLSGIQNLSDIDGLQADLNKTTIAWTLSPAVLQNNLQSSKVAFTDANIYNPLPKSEKDFEITSIEIESDHSFMPEFGNWIQAKGEVLTQVGNQEEIDIDFKSDKPLLPLRISPYAKNGKLQFSINNFNKFISMPWLYAKKFLGNNRDIGEYILQGNSAQWGLDLVEAVVNMFKMSHGFSTGFSEYRDSNGEILNDILGGVSIKSLETKGKYKDEAISVTQILKNWEYANSSHLKSKEFLRAKQILTASSQWVLSDYSFGAEQSEAHKTILDWYLDLDSSISKTTKTINMSLKSLRYEFDESDLTNPKIKGLIGTANESSVVIDETDRFTAIPELDDPISISSFSNFPKDYNLKSEDSLKYFVGLDITDPAKMEKFHIDQETSGVKIETITKSVDTGYQVAINGRIGEPDTGFDTLHLEPGQIINGKKLSTVKEPFTILAYQDGSITGESTIVGNPEESIKQTLSIPQSAYDIVIKSTGTQVVETIYVKYYWLNRGDKMPVVVKVNTKRYEGAVIEYKLKTTNHGVENKKFTYDKGTLLNMHSIYTSGNTFKRTLTISDDWRDDKGISVVKIKSINRLYLSFVLGNHIDIKINYKHDDGSGGVTTGSTRIPRLTLPSKHNERRTKFGVRI